MRLIVPAYGYPGSAPELWAALGGAGSLVEHVVVNVDSGPGAVTDRTYRKAVDRLDRSGIGTLAYIDIAYARKPAEAVESEARLWATRYGRRSIFLDQVPSSPTEGLSRIIRALRASGAEVIVANPGTTTHPDLWTHFDLVIDREHPASWLADGARRLAWGPRGWILHDVVPGDLGHLVDRAFSEGVNALWLTDLSGANPYSNLPSFWEDLQDRLGGLAALESSELAVMGRESAKR